MKRVVSVLCVAILSAQAVLTAGCEESQQISQTSDKRARLVSIENSSLKEQLQQQKDLLSVCQQEKVGVKEDSLKEKSSLMVIFDAMAKKQQAQNAKIAELKAQIADLETALKD